MRTVLDHARHWLMPSRALAATIHSHEGAYMIMNGTGTPTTQPATRTVFLPKRSARPPAKRLEKALISPKVTMNEKMAVLKTSPNSSDPTSGTTVRSRPTIPPTKAFTSTSSENCPRFSLSPSRTPCEVWLPERFPDAMKARQPRLASGATVGAGLELRWVVLWLLS